MFSISTVGPGCLYAFKCLSIKNSKKKFRRFKGLKCLKKKLNGYIKETKTYNVTLRKNYITRHNTPININRDVRVSSVGIPS